MYGSDTAPDEEAAGASGTETTPEIGTWFQRGSSNESVLKDRGIAVPVNAMLDRVREADAIAFDSGEDE